MYNGQNAYNITQKDLKRVRNAVWCKILSMQIVFPREN